jgi:hypothetical protein
MTVERSSTPFKAVQGTLMLPTRSQPAELYRHPSGTSGPPNDSASPGPTGRNHVRCSHATPPRANIHC